MTHTVSYRYVRKFEIQLGEISLLISNAETINGEIKQMSRFKYLGNKLRAPIRPRNIE